MRHTWIDPEEEISYTITPEVTVLSGGLEAELRPHYQAVAAPLAREILRLAARVRELEGLVGKTADGALTQKGLDMDRIAALEAENAALRGRLTLDDAHRIACGCLDYGGGYRNDGAMLSAFHHGIQTVCNALAAAKEQGLADTQVAALYSMGGVSKASGD